MIKIIKDGEVIECSKNTFETMFKRLGYSILEEQAKAEVAAPVEEVAKEAEVVPEVVEEKPAIKGKTSKKK